MKRRQIIQSSLGIALIPSFVLAQDKFPSKPITWVCPYAAGGGADSRSRQVAKVMGAMLGQPFIVDNKAGAGGNIGTEIISRAKPDGYTLGMGNFAPLAVNHALFKKLNFNPFTDISPILLIDKGPLIMMVRNDSPFTSVQSVVTAAKAAPGKYSYASGGIGGTHHLSGALFEHTAGIDLIHAPYKSGGAATTDLLGGQVHMMFEQMYAAMPAIKSGKLRPLAITSKTRSPLAPDIPTMAELGFPEIEVLNWQGLVGPKGMPLDLIKMFNSVGNKALQDPELKDRILVQGNEVGGGTPEQFAALIKSESVKWGKVVRDAKIEPE
jgi:tripartite-type tricarboxylate transporter receptor subunit TctC